MTTPYEIKSHKKFYVTLDSETLKVMVVRLDELEKEAYETLDSIRLRRSLIRRELVKRR